MMRKMRNSIISLLLILVMMFTLIPQVRETQGEEVVVTPGIEYNFANDKAGYAYGTISVTTEDAGTYDLYWGDSEGNKLSYNGVEFSELGSVTTTSESLTAIYQVVSPYTAIPEGAKELLLCNNQSQVVYTYDIPESKQFNEGELSYKFGVISDVHYNRYFEDEAKTIDQAVPAFETAMKFINDQGITFVACTGDLSANGEQDSYDKYNATLNKYPNITVYTTMGNHDTRNIDGFVASINPKAKTDANVKLISNDGADFVYEKGDDVFVFLSQVRWSYNTKYSYLLTTEQLNWLERTLNTYANKNIYLTFHSYFASENGDVTTAVGNLINPGGYTYDLTYTFGNEDEVRFRGLLNRYPNITVFSGHSHWAYDQQKYNPNLNIGKIKNDGTGATLVHISSVAEPRTIGKNDKERTGENGKKSEGTMAYRYADSTVYVGTDFKNGKYLAYATYISEDGPTSTPVAEIKTGNTEIKKVGKVKKVSKKSKKYQVTIKYKKVSQAEGYEIQYSTKKKFTEKTTVIKKTTARKYTIKKLKKGKKYYVRVRAYRTQFGEMVYGKWTKKVKIKVKAKKK